MNTKEHTKQNRAGRWLLCALGLLLLSGCGTPRYERALKDRPLGRSYTPLNVSAVASLPATLQRVAVLPFHAGPDAVDFDAALQAVMLAELRKVGRFEVLEISAEELERVTGQRSLSLRGPVPVELVEHLWLTYRAEGVLQTDITVYRAYKPMALGLQMRLFQPLGNQMLWSLDELFDAGDRRVAIAARKYAEANIQQAYPLQSSYSGLFTPRRFCAYAAASAYGTLPPRKIPR